MFNRKTPRTKRRRLAVPVTASDVNGLSSKHKCHILPPFSFCTPMVSKFSIHPDEFRFPVSLYSTNSRVYSRPTASSDQSRIYRKARSQATTAFKFRVITPSVIDCISSLLYYSGHSVSCPHSLFLSKSSVTWR